MDEQSGRSYRRGQYSLSHTKSAQIISVISSLSWVLLIWVLRLNKNDPIGWTLLSIPLIVYFINFSNSYNGNKIFDRAPATGESISFATITILVLINWAKPEGKTKDQIFKIILTAFILMMLSLINIFSSEKSTIQFGQAKSSLQTAGIVLFAYSLYKYYHIAKGQPGDPETFDLLG